MAKNNKKTPEVSEKKVETKYDRKMAARKEAEEKAKKQEVGFRIGCVVVAVLVIGLIVYSIVSFAWRRYAAVNVPYITIGDTTFTEQEMDFFTYTEYGDWLDNYSSYASLFGLDTGTDLDKQQYTDDMTWKDYFESVAISDLIQFVALYDAGQAAGLSYDTDTYYDSFAEAIEEAAQAQSMTVSEYYKAAYGKYATAASVEKMIRYATYASGYYNDLYDGIEVTDEEIVAAYQADPTAYDSIDFRVFAQSAEFDDDAEDEAKAAAMEELGEIVDEFTQRLAAGEDFNELCLEYASEDNLSVYEDDGSLNKALRYSEVSPIYADWLFDDDRATGDVGVFEDDDDYYYAIAMFIDRFYDTDVNDEIYSDLFEEKLSDIMAELTEGYTYTYR